MTLKVKNILIIGAGHGLGFGLVKECLSRYPDVEIFATYRLAEKAQELLALSVKAYQIDPISEASVEEYILTLPQLDLVINCVGVLHNEEFGPEKSLRDINIDRLTTQFQVNSMVTPLWGKYLKRHFSKDTTSVFATLSAMVGSIGENEVGGWYGYRASKTALNMFIKTMAIELARSGHKTSIVAIHPGTAHTELSKPFVSGVKHQIWQPQEAAANILNVLETCPDQGTGIFKNWDGRTILW